MTTTAAEIEPGYAFEARVKAALEEASKAAAAAAEAERAAYSDVDRLRGDHALGLIQRGQLLVGQRRLSAAQEASATAASVLRATERDIARQREARHALEVAAARQERQEREALKAASRERAAELWQRVFADLAEIDQLPGLPPLSSAGRAFDQAMGSLTQLRRIFNGK